MAVPLQAPPPPAETPYVGRTIATENFPVASRLISARFRPAIVAYYRMARLADDIADHPGLAAPEKIRRLDAIDAVLAGRAEAQEHDAAGHAAREIRAAAAAHGVAIEHARHLLQAFRFDALNRPCRTWSDLLAYCRYSAAPVGRFVLELHGEGRDAWIAADALCSALQILNHLQDCQADWRTLRRLYIPQDWLSEAGLEPAALLAAHASPALRRVLDRVLDGVDRLHQAAAPLPRLIADRGLRMQAIAVLALSRRLARRLRRRDPLAARVGVSQAEKMLALAYGAATGWWR
ncbi:MAG: squalene/phytoene synthase family protein [Alphaproteobacteria bacterium]|nr:squalene/phytoene synthase family protein [Alphaproteobacteria bacterium]